MIVGFYLLNETVNVLFNECEPLCFSFEKGTEKRRRTGSSTELAPSINSKIWLYHTSIRIKDWLISKLQRLLQHQIPITQCKTPNS